MTARPEISDEDLHGFVDHALDAERHGLVARMLGENPELAAKAAAFAQDKDKLASVFGPLIDSPVPEAWRLRIETYAPPPRASAWRTLCALAATVLLLLSFAFGARQLAATADEAIVREALAARSEGMSPNRSVAINSLSQRQQADRVLADAMGMRVRTPDLQKMGYTLASLRIYRGLPGGTAVELSYRNGATRDFDLYIRRPTSAARFDQFKRNGLRVCIWQDDVLGTVMTGKMTAAEMQRLASLAYSGLES